MVLDTGQPAVWEPWQLEVFADALDREIREVWAVVQEGSGKTTMVAAYALYHADHVATASVPIAARDRDQANMLLKVAGDIVTRSPGMAKRFQKRVHGLRVIRALRTGGEIKVYASNESGDGVQPTLAILDELHLHPSLELYAIWQGKLNKRRADHPTLMVISTAGEPDGEFEAARALAQEHADDLVVDGPHTRSRRGTTVVHDWGLPEGSDPMNLDSVLACQASGLVTMDDLESKLNAPGFRRGSWLRRTCNRPAREHTTAVAESDWSGCAVPGCRVSAECDAPVIGVDLGWRVDATGICLVGRDDGRIVVDDRVHEIRPPGGNESTRIEAVLGPIVDLAVPFAAHGTTVMVALDPTHEGHTIVQALRDRGMLARLLGFDENRLGELPLFKIVEIAQKVPAQVRMTARWLEAIRDRTLAQPANPVLTRNVMSGTLRPLPLGDVRFDRPDGGRPAIDVATAMLHAVDQVVAGELDVPRRPPRIEVWA